jgi:hypothetical protein
LDEYGGWDTTGLFSRPKTLKWERRREQEHCHGEKNILKKLAAFSPTFFPQLLNRRAAAPLLHVMSHGSTFRPKTFIASFVQHSGCDHR